MDSLWHSSSSSKKKGQKNSTATSEQWLKKLWRTRSTTSDGMKGVRHEIESSLSASLRLSLSLLRESSRARQKSWWAPLVCDATFRSPVRSTWSWWLVTAGYTSGRTDDSRWKTGCTDSSSSPRISRALLQIRKSWLGVASFCLVFFFGVGGGSFKEVGTTTKFGIKLIEKREVGAEGQTLNSVK